MFTTRKKLGILRPSSTTLASLTKLSAWAGLAAATLVPTSAQGPNPLITGKKITLPPIGPVQNVGSLPEHMIVSPNGKFAITSDMGFRESLWSIDTLTGKGVSHLDFNAVDAKGNPSDGLYYGIAAHDNGDGTATLYVATGQFGKILVVHLDASGNLTPVGGPAFATQAADFPAGVALDNHGHLFVANNDPNNFTLPASVAVYNTADGSQAGRYTFPGQANFPLSVAALADGSKVYVGSQRDGAVYVLNTTDLTNITVKATLPTGAHPDALLLDKSQKRLFVANAHSDSVSIVDTKSDTISSTIVLKPTGDHTPSGVTPTGLALSPDEKTLYVTLGDFNALAQVDVTAGQVLGYIPAGWYPTGVVATPYKKLLVANAKGTVTRYPNPSYQQFSFSGAYDLNLIEGNVEFLSVPLARQLAAYTQQVILNNKISEISAPNPLASISINSQAAQKIKHVIYIVKENRTYDQVLGDLPQGNGDPSLAIFGQAVTPNLHALANRFALLDNFYDCAEASGDGWPWSTQSIATEYVIKNLPYNYSGRGRQYDFEGQINGYPAGGFPINDPYGNPLVSPGSPFAGKVAPVIPDVSEAPGRHIWDIVRNAGLSYRNYGFFETFGVNFGATVVIPDNYPAVVGLQPAGHDLGGVTDIDFRRYDASYADSDAPQNVFNQTANPNALYPLHTYGHYNMPSRFSEWNREFQKFLAQDASGATVPAFETVRFMHDHTQGVSHGRHTPKSEVADNDYAVGQLVDAVSHSPIWSSTAIFVIEDDAQDGADHVDAHRSTCYVISPWIKLASVDHTFYNTDSTLKTIESLLGLKPMSEYDAVASPILDFDTAPINNAPFNAIAPDPAIETEVAQAKSPKDTMYALAKMSDGLDFEHPDSAPAGILNEIIWKSVQGMNSPTPKSRHSTTLRFASKQKTEAQKGKLGKKVAASRDSDD